MRIQLGEVSRGSGETQPYFGVGPIWLCLWWQVCGWFYGHYWRAHRRLEAEEERRGQRRAT